MGMKALILQSGEPSGSGAAVWVPSEDGDQILATHGECLIFVDALECENGNRDDTWVEQLTMALNDKYPNEHSLLDRISMDFPYNYSGPGGHYYKLKKVNIGSSEHRMYRDDDVEEVCQLARDFGSIRVKDSHFRIRRDNGIDNHTETMEEHHCYYRCLEEEGHEVVYDPKVIARRVKRGAKQSRTRRDNPKSFRIVPWLTIDELIKAINPLADILAARGCIDACRTHPFSIRYLGKPSRWCVIQLWSKTIEMFNVVFGKNAHRHVSEFQKFLRGPWKEHGAATKKSFGHGGSYRGNGSEIWNFLDYELTVRKPKKRKWTFDQTIRKRIDDQWLSISDRGELKKEAAAEEAKKAQRKKRKGAKAA